MRKSFLLGGAVAMLGLTACGDPLNVVNKNQPDVDRAYATPAGMRPAASVRSPSAIVSARCVDQTSAIARRL